MLSAELGSARPPWQGQGPEEAGTRGRKPFCRGTAAAPGHAAAPRLPRAAEPGWQRGQPARPPCHGHPLPAACPRRRRALLPGEAPCNPGHDTPEPHSSAGSPGGGRWRALGTCGFAGHGERPQRDPPATGAAAGAAAALSCRPSVRPPARVRGRGPPSGSSLLPRFPCPRADITAQRHRRDSRTARTDGHPPPLEAGKSPPAAAGTAPSSSCTHTHPRPTPSPLPWGN